MPTQELTITPPADDPAALVVFDAEGTLCPPYLDLDIETAKLSLDAREDRFVPEEVRHHRRLWLTLPQIPTPAGAADLLADAAPLARRIVAGTDIRPNGFTLVGVPNDDARAAEDALAALVAGYCGPYVEIHEADQWMEEVDLATLGITADTTDEQLREIAAGITHDAEPTAADNGEGLVFIRGMYERLAALRERDRRELRRELEDLAAEIKQLSRHRNELIERRDAAIRRQVAWAAGRKEQEHPDAQRRVAQRADINPAWVNRLLSRPPLLETTVGFEVLADGVPLTFEQPAPPLGKDRTDAIIRDAHGRFTVITDVPPGGEGLPDGLVALVRINTGSLGIDPADIIPTAVPGTQR